MEISLVMVMMEDYQAAFLRCVNDVEALDCAGRRIAAMHFGGIAIECLLKYMIFSSLPAYKSNYCERKL